MKEKPVFDSALVFWNLKGDSADECLRFLGQALTEAGKAKGDYTRAVLEREKVYPTGLEMPSISIAIPHANPINAVENAFAVAKLEHPVAFRHMADEEQEVAAELILMMCIAQPQIQAPMLSKVLEMFSAQDMGERVRACKNSEELYALLQSKAGYREE